MSTHVLRESRYVGGGTFRIMVSFGDGIMRLWRDPTGGDPVLDEKGQVALLKLLLERYPLDALAGVDDGDRAAP